LERALGGAFRRQHKNSRLAPGIDCAPDQAHQVPLARGTLRRQQLQCGGTQHCIGGSLWITCDGEPMDHVLDPGAQLRLALAARVVAYALDDAVLRVRPGAADRSVNTGRP